MFSRIKTKTRLALQLSFFISVAVTLISLIFAIVYGLIVQGSTRQELSARTEELMRDHIVLQNNGIYLKKNPHGETLGTILRYRSLSASIYDNNLRSVARYGAFLTGEADEQVEDSAVEIGAMRTVEKSRKPVFLSKSEPQIGHFETIVVPLFDEDRFLGILQIGKDTGTVDNLLHLNFMMILFFVPAGIAISFVLAHITVSSAFSPLQTMLDLTKSIETNALHKRIDVSGTKDDETRELSLSFNAMLDRLEEGVDQQKNFVSHASHELKTPLTQAISSLDLAIKNLEDGKHGQSIREIELVKKDLFHLNELVNTLLVSATIKRTGIKNIKIDVSKLWSEVVGRNKTAIREKKAKTISIFPVKHCMFDPQELTIIMNNLLSNALKYSSTPAHIEISFKKQAKKGVLAITDSGIGMNQTTLKHVFERFYRAHTGDTQGFGLGLSIVKEICDLRHLSIAVQSREKKGTQITISGFILDK